VQHAKLLKVDGTYMQRQVSTGKMKENWSSVAYWDIKKERGKNM